MAGTSFKGEPGLNASSAAHNLQTEDPHTDDIFKAFEALEDHCNLLDQKITSLSNQLETLERSLQKERELRELLETELHVSQAITMATYDARSQFLDNMSHEMRTPLNGILGMAQLVLDSPLTPEQRENIEAIQQSGQLLDDIISSLLDYSRLKQNQFPFEQNSFELISLLEETITDNEDRARDKNLEIALIPKPTTRCSIETDRGRLKQIIEILLDNALKFTAKGHVALYAELNRGPKNKGRLNLRVQDTGIGIEEDHLPFIFEPFWQAELSSTRKFGGLGMGLALCQELVVKMDGHIEVIESSAAGTTIEVSLPINILGKSPDFPAISTTHLDRDTLRAGLYNISKIEKITLSTLLAWHQVEVLELSPENINAGDVNAIDFIISDTNDKQGNALQKLLTRFEAGAPMPIFIGLVKSNQSIHQRDRQQFDIFLPTPIFHIPLQEAITFAVESLRNRKISRHQTTNAGSENGSTTNAINGVRKGALEPQQKVLLLDPVKLNQKIISHMLQSLNYEVEVVESVEQLEALDPDLTFNTTLINIMLDPEHYTEIFSGLSASKHLGPSHKFLGIQAKGAVAPAQAYTDAGISQFLTMPTSLDTLKKVMGESA